ncbi:fungal-specific transcription factor domain-containing protein [Aspergillus pseudoustus]|uniref:Fungal-specific transcription factor domain-containing protein n=1 Tax=Aspergillus pseudoustus TaxID=1810923 RepID=A0ABR4KRV6_9EURO
MSQKFRAPKGQPYRANQRVRAANRTLIACINCKEKKLKCDNKISGCDNCHRWGIVCLVEDPATRRQHPRNYLETLEQRVAFLEDTLKQYRPDLANDHLSQYTTHPQPESARAQFRMPQQDSENSTGTGTGLDELASKVGLLSLNAAGAEPHYLGSSSTFAFSRLINSSLRRVNGDPLLSSSSSSSSSSALPSPCPLPEYGIAVQLSNVFFTHVHPQYPFLHEPTFRAWEEAMLLGGVVGAQLGVVYAVGALLLPSAGCSAERLYVSSQLYIDHILPRENLETIQAILCCAVYSLRSSIGTSHWKLAGLALRQCIDLGYHRNSKRLRTTADPLRLELQKRVFWCAYSLESQAAVMLGRPQGITYHEVDAEYPLDIDDCYITESGVHGTPRTSPTDLPTTMTKAVHTFRIRRLLSRIHSSLYSNAPPQACCTGKHGHAAQIQALRAELEAWRAETPPLPQYPHEALALFSTPDWFDLEYNYTLLQLYRVEIIDYQRRDKNHPSSTTTTTNTETDTETTFLTVLHAASAICTSYRRQFLRNRPTMSYTWTALHELFLAGLTYCHCLWTSPAARRLYRYRYPGAVSRTCTDATVVLVLIAERWAGAAVYRNLFGVLAQRTAGMLDGDGEENGEAGEAEESWDKRETERDNDGEEQFGEWMARAAETGMSEGFEALLNSFAGEFSSESGFV